MPPTTNLTDDEVRVNGVRMGIGNREVSEGAAWQGVPVFRLRDLMRQEGIVNQSYLCGSAFWIIHNDVIDMVHDLSLGFWHKAKEAGLLVDVSAALGYAMQILCADPEVHLLVKHAEIWASDDEGLFRNTLPDGHPGCGLIRSPPPQSRFGLR